MDDAGKWHPAEDLRVHICAPPLLELRVIRATCWGRCQRRRYLLVESYEWYGPTVTCLRCGDQWSDGELLPRPFAPHWRQKNVERAKQKWRKYRATPPEQPSSEPFVSPRSAGRERGETGGERGA